jgi:hypothetical protein
MRGRKKMCDECDKLDQQIIYVRQMVDSSLEPLSQALLREALAVLEAERAALHSEK